MVILRRDAQQQLTETMEQNQPTQAIAFQAYEGVLRCFCITGTAGLWCVGTEASYGCVPVANADKFQSSTNLCA